MLHFSPVGEVMQKSWRSAQHGATRVKCKCSHLLCFALARMSPTRFIIGAKRRRNTFTIDKNTTNQHLGFVFVFYEHGRRNGRNARHVNKSGSVQRLTGSCNDFPGRQRNTLMPRLPGNATSFALDGTNLVHKCSQIGNTLSEHGGRF